MADDRPVSLRHLLESSAVFSTLDSDDLAALDASATSQHFEAGDLLIDDRDPLPILRILHRGIATMDRPGAEPVRLVAGDIVGQVIIEGDAPFFRALTPVTAFELDNKIVAGIFDREPRLLRDISRGLSSSSNEPTAIRTRTVQQRWQAATFLRAVKSALKRRQA